MKVLLILVIFAAILGLIIYNDLRLEEDHHAFFKDVREFMMKGNRNTAEDGYDLCIRTNILEEHAGIEPTDCEKKYGIKKGE